MLLVETSNQYSVVAKNTTDNISTVVFNQTTIEFDSGATRNLDHAGPAEILCSSFAACCLKNVSRFKEMLHLNIDYAEIEVTAMREEKPPRIVEINYLLKVKTTEDEKKLALLQKNLEQFGTIFNTLKLACPINGKIIKIGIEQNEKQ